MDYITRREKVIQNYINGYNQFDIEKMVADFDDNIVFENIESGELNMSLRGLTAFKQQAEKAKTYFKTRKQTLISFKHSDTDTEIEIDYYAVLEMDFPTGQKSDQELSLKGKSVFRFLNDKIIKLTDIS